MMFEKMGFMMSEARATAFGLLQEAAQELLDKHWNEEDTEDAMKHLKEVHTALMKIVDQETQLAPEKFLDVM